MLARLIELWKEPLPKDLERIPARVFGDSPEPHAAFMSVRHWPRGERMRRGFRLSFKILFPIMLALIPLGVLEPFAFMIWGSIAYGIILFIAGPMLFAKYYGEEYSFFAVETPCPRCQAPGPLRPYVSTRLEPEVTVLCGACGQTSKARPEIADSKPESETKPE